MVAVKTKNKYKNKKQNNMYEEDEDYYWEEEKDTSHWSKPNPKEHYTGSIATSGSTGSFKCPNCGSYNTGQSTYADYCNSCDWGQGY